jgi:hypothetical protein
MMSSSPFGITIFNGIPKISGRISISKAQKKAKKKEGTRSKSDIISYDGFNSAT